MLLLKKGEIHYANYYHKVSDTFYGIPIVQMKTGRVYSKGRVDILNIEKMVRD